MTQTKTQMKGSGTTVITVSHKGEVVKTLEQTHEFLVDFDVLMATTHVAKIHLHGGITRNMGDYNMLRVDTGVEIPCLPTIENMESTFQFAKTWVGEHINEIEQEALEE